jgi:transcriptional regulator with XRE-family HTH domain
MSLKTDKKHNLILAPFEGEALQVFARRLRHARLRRNLTQDVVAERAGLSRGAVVAAETAAPGTSLGTIVKILGVFGLAERLGEVLAVDVDGELIEQDIGRQRARKRHGLADF